MANEYRHSCLTSRHQFRPLRSNEDKNYGNLKFYFIRQILPVIGQAQAAFRLASYKMAEK